MSETELVTELDVNRERPIITESIAKQAATDEELQKTLEKRLQVPWYSVQEAIDMGYVIPGWNLIDYIRSTWMGYPNDPKNPLHPERPRMRFQCLHLWGEQGVAKSNFAAQIMGLVYGGYNRNLLPEERKAAWDWCQKMMIVNKDDLISVYGLVTKTNQRLKAIVLDDINSIFSKQLWREDAELYMKLFKMLGMIRRKVGTLITTEPNIEFVQRALGDITTIEALATPNGSYKVERYVHDVHPYYKLKDKVTKVMIEYAKFNIYNVPTWWWDIYQERTNAEGNEGFNDVVEYMQEAANGEGDIDRTVKTLERQDIPLNEIIGTLRSAGVKGSQEQLLEAAKLLKAKRSERAKKILNEKTLVMTDEKL